MSPASDRTPLLSPGVIACTLRGRRASDAIEIVTERDGAICLVVLDVRAARDQEALRAKLASSALVSLAEHEPMHVLANGLRNIVCQSAAASVGVVALKVHPMHGRVELLNAETSLAVITGLRTDSPPMQRSMAASSSSPSVVLSR